MTNYSRYEIFLQLLLHEKDDSLWHAEFVTPVQRQSFSVQDLISGPDLILTECNQNFVLRCGSSTATELIGRPINQFIFGDRITDVTIHNDGEHRPYIVKFRTANGTPGCAGRGYMNTVGLITDDTWVYGMLGRQYDITPQLKKTAERQAVKEKLTVKEFEIFLSLAKGHTVKDIAGKIGSTEKAVYFHIENIERKMKTQSIIGIVQQAYRLGFMDSTTI